MLSSNLLLSSFLSLYCTLRALLPPLDCLGSRHCLLSNHVFISLPFIPSLSLVHSSIDAQSNLSITSLLSLLHLLLSFSLPVSDSCAFKFMLMIFPNLISESRDWGWLYRALKVIGLQVSHSRGFGTLSVPPIYSSESFIQLFSSSLSRCPCLHITCVQRLCSYHLLSLCMWSARVHTHILCP